MKTSDSISIEVDYETAINEKEMEKIGIAHEERVRSGNGAYRAVYQGNTHQFDNIYAFHYNLFYIE